MKKYYWFLWSHNNAGGGVTHVQSVIINKHPFIAIGENIKASNHLAGITLLNWKEISGEEYDLGVEYFI